MRLALAALDDLRRLDESLYERFVGGRAQPLDPDGNAAGLRQLWSDTFRGLLKLLALCRAFAQPRARTTTEPDVIPEIDFGEGGTPAVPEVVGELDLGAGDIGDLLENFSFEEPSQPNVMVREEHEARLWDDVLEKVSSIEYGLRSQYTDATARMTVALAAGETNQVLGLLDDAQSSASEGVHALVAAVYQAFAGDVDSTTVVPGYLTSLGRALLVRRGIAELSRILAGPNAVLQGSDSGAYPAALATICEAVHDFTVGAVGRAMRPADRWQMGEFDRALATEPVGLAKLTSEGLVKYLESLGSINQREVLLIHDRRALEAMRDALATAHQLIDLSPRTAREMVAQAYRSAQRLRGRDQHTDELLAALPAGLPAGADLDLVRRTIVQLEGVFAALGG